MDVLGRHNLVTWQRRGGILPQLPAGSLLKYLGFVCFDACVCNESIFVLCLLFCVVCVCVQEGGCMHLLVHINWLFGFISLLEFGWMPIPATHTFSLPYVIVFVHWHLAVNTHRHPYFSSISFALYAQILPFSSIHTKRTNPYWCFSHFLCYYTHSHICSCRHSGPTLALRTTQNDMRRVPAAWFPLLIHTLAQR